jgi:hypothetical protein
MAEKQILSFKPATRLEQVGYKHSERVQDCKHRSQWCDDSASQCESGPDGIFGRDRVLILFYFNGGNPSVAMHDFSNKAACEHALATAVAMHWDS